MNLIWRQQPRGNPYAVRRFLDAPPQPDRDPSVRRGFALFSRKAMLGERYGIRFLLQGNATGTARSHVLPSTLLRLGNDDDIRSGCVSTIGICA